VLVDVILGCGVTGAVVEVETRAWYLIGLLRVYRASLDEDCAMVCLFECS
jgi:hypothetical protein